MQKKLSAMFLLLSLTACSNGIYNNVNCKVHGTCDGVSRELVTEETFNLASDTLFKFDKFNQKDVLKGGLSALQKLADKIKSEYVRVEEISVIGHTDRLGSDEYNDRLGLNRAKTVRSYLKQYGIQHRMFAKSAGEKEPITDGCFNVQGHQNVINCLQPDRRVIIKVVGEKEIIKPKQCGVQKPKDCTKTTKELVTESFNLASDTLFKFDKFTENDVLSGGLSALQGLAEKINSEYEQIEEISVIGHTDRLGSDAYNDRLGLNRAKTVRSYLKDYGVKDRMLALSAGEKEPVTNGCFNIQGHQNMIDCLQPDRRVIIKVVGLKEITKTEQCEEDKK